MRFSPLQGIVCRIVPRIIGFPRCATIAVSGPDDAFSIRPSPGPLETGSFPHASCPLRSAFAVLPASPSLTTTCLGVPSLFAVSPEESTVRGFPNPRCVPSSGFLNLSTVCSASGFAGFFHPATTSRVSVQGLGPVPQLYRLVAGLCLPALSEFALTGCPAATLARRASRLSSTVRGDRRGRWLAYHDAAPLFGVSSSRFSLPDRAAELLCRDRSALDLLPAVFAFPSPFRRSLRG